MEPPQETSAENIIRLKWIGEEAPQKPIDFLLTDNLIC